MWLEGCRGVGGVEGCGRGRGVWWEGWRCVGGVECGGRVKCAEGRAEDCSGRGRGVWWYGWRGVVGGVEVSLGEVVCGWGR